MNAEDYSVMYRVEKEYWWFAGKRYLLSLLLKKYIGNKNNLKILDVGCGTGIIMKMLGSYGKVYGIDSSDVALNFCRKRGIKNIKKADVCKIPYREGEFDLVTALNVLYHKNVKDDFKAISEMHRVLKPGGIFIMTESAMKCLFGKHDIRHYGARRYSKKELLMKLKKAGFKIEKITFFNFIFFPFAYISRKLGNLMNLPVKSDVDLDINPLLNNFLKIIFKAEIFFIKYMDYPFGINIACACRKGDENQK